MGRRILSGFLWALGIFICIVLIIAVPYGAAGIGGELLGPGGARSEGAAGRTVALPTGSASRRSWRLSRMKPGGGRARGKVFPALSHPASHDPALSTPASAATSGYVIYHLQSAWSGMLPVNYLSSSTFSTCIGLFADYNVNAPSGPPAVNSTIALVGYNVSVGGWFVVGVGQGEWWLGVGQGGWGWG